MTSMPIRENHDNIYYNIVALPPICADKSSEQEYYY